PRRFVPDGPELTGRRQRTMRELAPLCPQPRPAGSAGNVDRVASAARGRSHAINVPNRDRDIPTQTHLTFLEQACQPLAGGKRSATSGSRSQRVAPRKGCQRRGNLAMLAPLRGATPTFARLPAVRLRDRRLMADN